MAETQTAARPASGSCTVWVIQYVPTKHEAGGRELTLAALFRGTLARPRYSQQAASQSGPNPPPLAPSLLRRASRP